MEIAFHGKRALVTGATRGFGRDIAKQLAKCGAEVIAVGRSVPNLASLKQEEPSIHTIPIDLANWDATRNILKDIGPIDLLVNNAGVGIAKPLTEYTKEDIDNSFDLNIKAVINITQLVAENLLERKVPGSIVNVSSLSSILGGVGFSVYSATKGALDAYTRATALELGPHNIRVNSVNPTAVLTDMGKEVWSDPVKAQQLLAITPLKRFGEIHEVVDAVLFLLSDKASMITGTCLPIDGGTICCFKR